MSRIEAEISPWTDEMTMNVVTIGFPKEKLEETFKMTENKLENHSRIASLCNLNRSNKRLSVPKRIIIRSKTNEKISLDKHLKERRTHVIDDNNQEYPSMLVTNDSLSGESSHHAQISQQISNFNRNSRLSNTHKPLKLPRVASDKQLTRISVGESTTRINKRDKTP